MLKLLVLIVIIASFAVGGFFLYKNLQSQPLSKVPFLQPQQTTPSAGPSGSCEVLTSGNSTLPELYSGVKWTSAEMAEFNVPLGEKGEEKMSGCKIQSQIIKYLEGRDTRISYSNKLIRSGWNPLVSADGTYTSVESYQKDRNYFVIQQKVAPGTDLPTSDPDVVIELFYAAE